MFILNMSSDTEILKIFKPILDDHYIDYYSRKETCKSEFTLDDLVGMTILSHRKIKNPRLFEGGQSSNPEYLGVLEFKDGWILLTEHWGDLECGHLDSYLFDGKRVLYSDSLFQ